ncbi:uncharacterized protein BJ171DRAFT_84190 [Polychytrium aggregatum]|uniref:uncharacterized protein n=1 Tax=Polychytrium aggregatum TaxID=110093 RepID=UPI0022FEE78C|nr:uncharacterized protein BJ171DRAFT_84190 [Polychytrium aggregatum]KAI9205166.1 hypothetical protein BJ171DRAFT_84190 [Polychytrium aggregatum]
MLHSRSSPSSVSSLSSHSTASAALADAPAADSPRMASLPSPADSSEASDPLLPSDNPLLNRLRSQSHHHRGYRRLLSSQITRLESQLRRIDVQHRRESRKRRAEAKAAAKAKAAASSGRSSQPPQRDAAYISLSASWPIWLPGSSPYILDLKSESLLIDCFFDYTTHRYMPCGLTKRRPVADLLARLPDHLVAIMIAFGMWHSEHAYIWTAKPALDSATALSVNYRTHYYQKARSLVSFELDHPSIAALQTLVLLAHYTNLSESGEFHPVWLID